MKMRDALLPPGMTALVETIERCFDSCFATGAAQSRNSCQENSRRAARFRVNGLWRARNSVCKTTPAFRLVVLVVPLGPSFFRFPAR
jgi:hypothetical protein